MKSKLDTRRRGQALVMVTLALFAMVGLIGLAVDLSWGYFLEKTLQAAADAAAISAVHAAREAAGSFGTVDCTTATCHATPADCASGVGALDTTHAACVYAADNGFTSGAGGNLVTIVASDALTAPTVADAACSPSGLTVYRPPTADCVDTLYWVTVRISQQVPQLFSAILGNYSGRVSARATAAIAETELQGSLLLLNRALDNQGGTLPNTAPPYGTNLELQGSGRVNVPGGIHLASGSSLSGHESGRIQGASAYVVSPSTRIRSGGAIGGSHYQNWICTWGGAFCPPTATADGPDFFDPMRVKNGQPPLGSNFTSGSLPIIEVPGGSLNDTTICPGWVCSPGIYVATEPNSCGGCVRRHPSGEPIRFPNNTTISFQGGTFGDFMFVGGLHMQTGSTVTMGPGRYVFAGTLDPSRDNLFDIPNGVTINGGNGNDAGRILIFTDFRDSSMRDLEGALPGSQAIQSYAGEMETVYNQAKTYFNGLVDVDANGSWNRTAWASSNTGLGHGPVAIQAGNNASSQVNLYGLAKGTTFESLVPAELRPFAPVAMWQDQHNSYVRYTQTSQIDIGCAAPNNTLDQPCTQTPDDDGAPGLLVWATPHTTYQGAIYQPRGSWTTIQASGNYSGPLQIISGAMKVQGSPELTLTGVTNPITVFATALVE